MRSGLFMTLACASLMGAAGCGRPARAGVDREAAQYEQYRQPQKVIAGLALAPGMRVADVGAGRGFLTTRIAAAVGARGHVVATDIDGRALAAIAPAPAIETRVVRADDPGLERGAYDRILVAEVDQYLPDRAGYLARLARALAPGGFIAVSNRMPYRAPLLAAAARAGLRATELPLGLPAHFFVKLEPTP
ncbi:MAG TPA: methyltransferase [Polyangia bacterium]|nr:methyltransferase [Polyangia bacterium]